MTLEEISYYAVYYLVIISKDVTTGMLDFEFGDFYKIGKYL